MSTSVWLVFAAAVAGFAAAWLALELRRAWSPDSLRHLSTDDSETVAYLRALGDRVAQLEHQVSALQDHVQPPRAEPARTPPPGPEPAPERAREIYNTRPPAEGAETAHEYARLQEYLAAQKTLRRRR